GATLLAAPVPGKYPAVACSVSCLLSTGTRKTDAAHAAPALIPQRLSGFQHMLHARLRLGVGAKAQERFSFQVQKRLLRDELLAGETAAAKDVGELFAYLRFVL